MDWKKKEKEWRATSVFLILVIIWLFLDLDGGTNSLDGKHSRSSGLKKPCRNDCSYNNYIGFQIKVLLRAYGSWLHLFKAANFHMRKFS